MSTLPSHLKLWIANCLQVRPTHVDFWGTKDNQVPESQGGDVISWRTYQPHPKAYNLSRNNYPQTVSTELKKQRPPSPSLDERKNVPLDIVIDNSPVPTCVTFHPLQSFKQDQSQQQCGSKENMSSWKIKPARDKEISTTTYSYKAIEN